MSEVGPSASPVDILIVGGGLSGSLIAWALAERRPDLSIRLLEKGERLGGNHTWSFHETDVPPATLEWLRPLMAHRWAGQSVRFPRFERHFDTAYASVTSENLHRVVGGALKERAVCGIDVQAIDADGVTLRDGTRIDASAVIDARGQRGFEHLVLGYQKFVGCEYEFAEPHGLTTPIIMDATVPQLDGYRFIYVLPFSETSALVEDTYYADGSDIDVHGTTRLLEDYCQRQGWTIRETLRTEHGILPVAMGGDIGAHLAGGIDGVATVGLRAGLFHPLTGYSLPDAAAMALGMSGLTEFSGSALTEFARQYAVDTWNGRGFYRMLSRFLFDAAKPDERYLVMQRFYRLNQGLIERFYAGRSLPQDKLRVLAGKPPVNFFKALACVSERQWTERFLAAA